MPLLHNLGQASAAQRAQVRPPLVLIAEDDEDTRCMFRKLLEITGYQVIEATNGEQAIRLAESARPDLILMDGGLPLLDGFNATHRIRCSTGARHTPIVFISGHAEDASLARARAAGCDEYLVKPVDFDRLAAVMERYVHITSRFSNI